MSRPVLVKLGGSIITDKARESTLKRAVAKRLLGEIQKSEVQTVLLHGAGSFGHPQAKRAGLGEGPVRDLDGVAETLAAVGSLHAAIVELAAAAGLQPCSVPLHLACTTHGTAVDGMPVRTLESLLDAGFTPVLNGTVVRDEELGWRVLGADEIAAELAHEMDLRFGLFASDVEGVYDRHPEAPGAQFLPVIGRADVEKVVAFAEGPGEDVTGRMRGKLQRALEIRASCPVVILNGTVRGRLHDALRGKHVPGTRIETS